MTVTGCIYRLVNAMTDLTPRQTQILRLIQTSIAENGMPPTRAEIARTFGFKSPNAAEEHLRALQRKGVIDLIPGASRGIQLKDILREQLGLPLIGRVAAGRPILAEEHIERHYQIDPQLFQPQPHYLLKVQGMSMKNAGILHGDRSPCIARPRCAIGRSSLPAWKTKSPSNAIARKARSCGFCLKMPTSSPSGSI